MKVVEVPFYRHQLAELEKAQIADSLKNPILTSGPICKAVESQISEYFGVGNAKLVNSWTNGALATLMSFGVGPGDEVIVPNMTFIACANIVELLGATTIFADVSDTDLLITNENIRPLITSRTKVIMVVHLYGQMADVRRIAEEFSPLGIRIIEDCAHSFESTRDGFRPGKFSDAAIFSFYATKNITCGEGGVVISNNTSLHLDLTQRILHGMSAGAADRFKTGTYSHWNMDVLGIKANLPDILASLLPSQIEKAESNRKIRSELAARYDRHFNQSPLRLITKVVGATHAHHLYPIWIPNGLRDAALQILSEYKIGATVNFRPVNVMNYYCKKYGNLSVNTPNSAIWGGGVLSLPLYPGLSIAEQDYVINVMESKVLSLIQ